MLENIFFKGSFIYIKNDERISCKNEMIIKEEKWKVGLIDERGGVS